MKYLVHKKIHDCTLFSGEGRRAYGGLVQLHDIKMLSNIKVVMKFLKQETASSITGKSYSFCTLPLDLTSID